MSMTSWLGMRLLLAVCSGMACTSLLVASDGGAKPPSGAEAQRLALLEAGRAREFPALDWAKRTKSVTIHYRIETNVPADTSHYIQVLLEAMYSCYSAKLGVSPPAGITVYVYATSADFAADVKESLHHVLRPGEGGMYVSEKHAMYIPWVAQRSGLQPSAILMHEGFHQFYDAALRTTEPKWFNEGMATYFENADFDGVSLKAGFISPSKLKGMQMLYKTNKNEPLLELMKKPADQFIGNQYCEAWSLIYWMMWGESDEKRRTAQQKKLTAYFASLKDLKNHTPEALEREMGIKLTTVETSLVPFVQALDPNDRFGGLKYIQAQP